MPNQTISESGKSVNDKLQDLYYQVFGVNYTLKELSFLSFERWAELIDIENETNTIPFPDDIIHY